MKTMSIPPQLECNIGIKISKRNSGDIALFEPVKDIQSLNLMIAKCLVKISQNEAIIRVLNPTSKSVTIPTSKVLVTVCDIDTHSIQELNDSPSTNANMNLIDTSTNTKGKLALIRKTQISHMTKSKG